MNALENNPYYSDRVSFSSKKDDWTTPRDLFQSLNKEFGFTVDLCADENNHLCDKFFTADNDGLKADIRNEIVFCNPPYGRSKTGPFVKKCSEIEGGGGGDAASRTHGSKVVS